MILTSDAPAEGRHRVEPGALVAVTASVYARTAILGGTLITTVPGDWTVIDAAGGAVDPADGVVRWALDDLEPGTSAERHLLVRAPALQTDAAPVTDGTFEGRVVTPGDAILSAVLVLRVAPRLVVEHVTFAQIDPLSGVPSYLDVDADLDDVLSWDRFRVRFQVRNADLVGTTILPRLQYRATGDARFVDLPAGDPELDVPLYLANEWRAAGRGRVGTVVGPELEPIPVGDLKSTEKDEPDQRPAPGQRLMGAADPDPVAIAGDTFTEVELTLRATVDLPYGRSFELRLTDDGRPLPGAVTAIIHAGGKPGLILTPGQRRGVEVGPPVDAPAATTRSDGPTLRGDVDYALVPPDVAVTARPAVSTSLPRYQLAVAVPTTPDAAAPLTAPFDSPHVPDTSLVTDTCARCHSAHTAQGPALLPDPNPQSTLCLSCHDGSGSDIDVAATYSDPAIPANDTADRAFYRHDALAPSTHVLASDEEFAGTLDRHSECGDCHSPHNAVATDATQTVTGWTVSGRQQALSGVSVEYATGSPPAYTFLDGSYGLQPTREYEICLKCHSGYTVLPETAALPPSRQAVDKGLELDPSNASYHPISAPGKNLTAAMANSLAGSSPYKLWSFTTSGTVRCVSCHGDPAKADPATPPAAGSALAAHASANRGLLIESYRDRDLKPVGEAYDATDFALCYVCHAEAPYLNIRTGMTAFDLHALHVSDLPGGSGGLDIDTPGAGQGYAICAECHFRLHSTAEAVNDGDRDNSRLVNFAPNVQANNGVLEWTKVGAGGTCTLTCHGEPHQTADY